VLSGVTREGDVPPEPRPDATARDLARLVRDTLGAT
jgi:hypothetical protein